IASGDVDADAITDALGDIEFAEGSEADAGSIAGDLAGDDFVNAGSVESALSDAGFTDANVDGEDGLSGLAGALADNEAINEAIVSGDALDAGAITDAMGDDYSFVEGAGGAADSIAD